MNRTNLLKTGMGLLAVVLLAVYSSASLALTAAGTIIGNLATVNYQVSGISQPAIGSSVGGNSNGAGTPTNFTVDDKVVFTVTTVDGADVAVTPGQNTATPPYLTYLITNTGNATHGFLFSTVNEANATANPFAGNVDDFDAVTPTVHVAATCATATYTVATDTSSSLFSLAAGATCHVFIVVPNTTGIPTSQVNGDVAVMALVGQAAATGATYAAGAGAASEIG